MKNYLNFIAVIFLFLIFGFWANRAQARIPASTISENSVLIDENTAKQGITLRSQEGLFKIGFTPGVLGSSAKIKIATKVSGYHSHNTNHWRISPIYEYAIMEDQAYDGRQPILLEFSYENGSLGKKDIRFFDENEGVWKVLPSQSFSERKMVRAQIFRTFAEVAVFEDDSVLETGFSSWYKYKNCDCAASPDYPKGTKLKVTNLKNNKSVIVKINDWGPERDKYPDRVIDLDLEAFKKIANPYKGLTPVKVEVVKF